VSTTHLRRYPDADGYYGPFGGNHYPPELDAALGELDAAYQALRHTPEFSAELDRVRHGLQGRPTPIHHLANLTRRAGGAQIYVKREDLNHTGAHKINHCVGFALLAKRMGKRKLIAQTGAGQHGVALAATAAYFGLDCEVHMGGVDLSKASTTVDRMRLMGARIVSVGEGQSALKEASDSAFRAYAQQHEHALYAIGSAIGPHPFPMLVRDFQAVIGHEARDQFRRLTDGASPDHVLACLAGGSNAIGIFAGFLDDPAVALHAVEPRGNSDELGQHAATLTFGRPGTLHGARSVVLQHDDGAVADVTSAASGLVYPGVGPEIAMLHAAGRLAVAAVTDEEAIEAFFTLSRTEGIIPALESAHALAHAERLAARLPSTARILVNLSGRGDKDIDYVMSRHGARV
jgi:tryptophan synthase beta chain